MHRKVIALALMLGLQAQAHEMVPTYPRLMPSHIENVAKADMALFNKRMDVEFYEIGVFDGEWNAIPFVSSYKIIPVGYLEQVKFTVYVSEDNRRKAQYVCSVSKLRSNKTVGTLVSSKICSKFKQ